MTSDVTHVKSALMEELISETDVFVNEADWFDLNFKRVFYGGLKYARLMGGRETVCSRGAVLLSKLF